MARPRNVVVAQSGGPTPVINNSLRAVVETCRSMPERFANVYAGAHGIEGVLRELLLDMSAQDSEEVALLRTTPAAGAAGTCRYKLKAHQEEDFDVGVLGERKDSFGHTTFSSSEMTAGQIVVNHLNRVGLAARGSARGNIPGTDQRDSIIHASTVDLEEAYQVGQHAVLLAAGEGSGYMATILRRPGPGYRVHYDKVPLEVVANSERKFPEE